MLEILVSHLEKACGLKIIDVKNSHSKSDTDNKQNSIEVKEFDYMNVAKSKDQNVEDIV